MATFLLTWNPKRYAWDELRVEVEAFRRGERAITQWSCGSSRYIQKGDRVFLMRLGVFPKGIVASGHVTRETFEADHWDEEKYRAGIPAHYIEFQYDAFLNPEEDEILRIELLDQRFPAMYWHPQGSGVRIREEVVGDLEQLWAMYASRRITLMPEEISSSDVLVEGASRQVTVNAYERNLQARKRCIEHYGAYCCICGMNFKDVYGEIGQGFINVHHLIPIAGIGEQYEIDPVRDLRPVCPNCHAMLHRKDPPFSIGELRAMIEQAGKHADLGYYIN